MVQRRKYPYLQIHQVQDKLKELEKLMKDCQITKEEYEVTKQTLLKATGGGEGKGTSS